MNEGHSLRVTDLLPLQKAGAQVPRRRPGPSPSLRHSRESGNPGVEETAHFVIPDLILHPTVSVRAEPVDGAFSFSARVAKLRMLETIMATNRRWTADETRNVLKLYDQIPFGQFHQHNPKIISIAKQIDRTPSSVAMKLCNFASLDPKITQTGRKGLAKSTILDRKIWAEHKD
jgi:hypothetical protein